MAFHVVDTRIELLPEAKRPPVGEALVIPANDHLWMGSGPGLSLKMAVGKELEHEAVRLGPVPAGQAVVMPAPTTGYRFLFHAVVTGPDQHWIPGAGKRAVLDVIAQAEREKLATLVFYPLYRGVHGSRADAAREMLSGCLQALEKGSTLRTVSILVADPEEQSLLHEMFLRLLREPPS